MATPVRETAPGLGFAFTPGFRLAFAAVDAQSEQRQYFAEWQGPVWGGVETGDRDRSDPGSSGTLVPHRCTARWVAPVSLTAVAVGDRPMH